MKSKDPLQIISAFLLAAFLLTGQRLSAGESFPKTPPDYEGPFYPVTRQQDEDNDLIHVKGRTGVARGDILNLSGVVLNSAGRPQQDVTIEIWQTDPQGTYKHPGDSTPGERDPNFQYWGRATTGPDGSYSFKTIVPGAYHPRPAHIHYKVLQNGRVVLTSQIYFKKDLENRRRPAMTQQIDLQTVDLQPVDEGEFKAFFRIVI